MLKRLWRAGILVAGCAAMISVGRGAEAEPEARISRTFEVKSGGKLVLRSDRGSVTLSGGDRSTVEVEVDRRATRVSDAKARELLEAHEVRFLQEGDTVRVEAELKGGKRWMGWGPGLEVAIRVLLPKDFNVLAETGGGSVSASRLRGELSLRTSGGSVHVESLSGRVHCRTSGGSVKAAEVEGQVELETSGGSITVDAATGSQLKTTTAGGSIRLSRVQMPVDARTSGGSITLETSVGPVYAQTSGGSITARLTGTIKEGVQLKTSAGGITVSLPRDLAFDLDAATSAGRVSCDLPIEKESGDGRDRSSMRGAVNGGGPAVKLRTSAGSIRVKGL